MTNRFEAIDLLIRRLRLDKAVPAEDEAALHALPCTLRTLEAGSYLVREGEPPTTCAVLISGFAFRQKLTSDGQRQIVSLHIPGEPVDFQNLFLDVSDHNVQTLTRASLALIPRENLRDLVRTRPIIARAVLVYTLIEASIFREWVMNVGRRNARTRTAHLLCEFAVRLDALKIGGDGPYELPMTQEQLGDALGLTAVHVNRTLRAMQADGLIARDRRKITIPDWRALRTVADFNERYLHLEQQPQN